MTLILSHSRCQRQQGSKEQRICWYLQGEIEKSMHSHSPGRNENGNRKRTCMDECTRMGLHQASANTPEEPAEESCPNHTNFGENLDKVVMGFSVKSHLPRRTLILRKQLRPRSQPNSEQRKITAHFCAIKPDSHAVLRTSRLRQRLYQACNY